MNQWISVKDRLPDEFEDEDILVNINWIYGYRVFIFRYCGDDEWIDDEGVITNTKGACITHWMPLPEAPKI